MSVIVTSTGGNTVAGNVFVLDNLVFTGFSAGNSRLQVGAVTNGTASLNAIAAADVTFTMTSSNPAVASVPSSVVMPAGSSSASVPVTGVSAGAVTITVDMGGVTRGFSFVVVTEPILNGFSLSSGSRAVVGAPTTITLSVDAVLAQAREVTLSSTNAAALAVPGKATLPPGATSLVVPVSVLAAGMTTLKATLGGVTRSLLITVVATQTLTGISFAGRLVVGAVSDLTVSIDVASTVEVPVTLTSSNPDVISVPSTIIINPGATTACSSSPRRRAAR